MKEIPRNHEIENLLDVWEWCSRTRHVKWQRKRRHRNECLVGLAYAVGAGGWVVSPFELPLLYETWPAPLLDEAGLLCLWKDFPATVLGLRLGVFTQGSPLALRLEEIRQSQQDNPALDKLVKVMRSREKRFGSDWSVEGHHPENEFLLLKKEMAPVYAAIKETLLAELVVIEALAREVLAQGPWKGGELPATAYLRKTPESLLNRAIRLRLWQRAQEILSSGLDEHARLRALCDGLHREIKASDKAAIEAQGYSVEDVVDDVLNFDMHKSRAEVTGR